MLKESGLEPIVSAIHTQPERVRIAWPSSKRGLYVKTGLTGCHLISPGTALTHPRRILSAPDQRHPDLRLVSRPHRHAVLTAAVAAFFTPPSERCA